MTTVQLDRSPPAAVCFPRVLTHGFASSLCVWFQIQEYKAKQVGTIDLATAVAAFGAEGAPVKPVSEDGEAPPATGPLSLID